MKPKNPNTGMMYQNLSIPVEEIVLDFETNGVVTCPWWTKASHKLTTMMGLVPLPGYKEVASNPWCG